MASAAERPISALSMRSSRDSRTTSRCSRWARSDSSGRTDHHLDCSAAEHSDDGLAESTKGRHAGRRRSARDGPRKTTAGRARMRLLKTLMAGLAALAFATAPALANPKNALDAYVAKKDPAFSWKVVGPISG